MIKKLDLIYEKLLLKEMSSSDNQLYYFLKDELGHKDLNLYKYNKLKKLLIDIIKNKY